ncbi:Hypothetical protein A7982_11804 [Minicystis rosea]|nr:Hypothetical protein A7982_11804 [Minicystis rosea]
MKLRDVALCLVGGSIMYVSMAACAGRPSGQSSSGMTVHQGTGGSTPGTGGSGNTIPDSGIGDALTDPVGSAHAEPTPGSRLKPKYRVGDDGAKEYLAGLWFDSQRNEDCSFALAADGKTRCLPQGTEFRYFADASCETPMVLLQNACSAPKYAVSNTDAACGLDPSAIHVYAVDQPTTPAMIYGKSGGSCFAIGPSASEYLYYTVGAEVPASAFVAATVAHD